MGITAKNAGYTFVPLHINADKLSAGRTFIRNALVSLGDFEGPASVPVSRSGQIYLLRLKSTYLPA